MQFVWPGARRTSCLKNSLPNSALTLLKCRISFLHKNLGVSLIASSSLPRNTSFSTRVPSSPLNQFAVIWPSLSHDTAKVLAGGFTASHPDFCNCLSLPLSLPMSLPLSLLLGLFFMMFIRLQLLYYCQCSALHWCCHCVT